METQSNTKPLKAVVVHSPFSGRSAQLSQALDLLDQSAVQIIDVIAIADLDHQPLQGERWQERGATVAIAAGGDGLIGGVITHIAESGLPLGILPLGTSNDIARSLAIPLTLLEATQVIAIGNSREMDIGTAQPAEQAPHAAHEDHLTARSHGYFAHALTVGLNVQFAKIATNVATRQRYGKLAYSVAALEVWTHREPLDVTLSFTGLVGPDGEDMDQAEQPPTLYCCALEVAVINAPVFGGQLQLSLPQASIDDRLLDIVVIENINMERMNAAIAQLFHPRQQRAEAEAMPPRHPAELSGIPGLHHFQATSVLIKTGTDPQDVTLDGELRGQTPVHIALASKSLRVMLPVNNTIV
jgi:diacylglycerol kinase (ATP)